ncbi:cytochrome c oxidase assembly protein [Pilimelia columellifera]|uniref:Cytochrome c oxidase assembly protein n=1 Tax=Pilimelia columellifera subsp. columellifera TaxID=706583 RepID=A0ABP6B0H8_9ACTN
MPAHPDHAAGVGLGPLLLVWLLADIYVLAAASDRRGWSGWRTTAWLTGCAVLAVALSPLSGPPGDPRAHMAQHLLLGMLAPFALALGAPVTLLLRTAPPLRRPVTRILRWAPMRLLAHPATAAVLTTGGLAAVMLTPLYAAAERHPALHDALHLHYLAAGYLFAWAVAGPDPAPRRPALAVRAGALLAAAAGHAVLAKHLYAHAGDLPPGAGHPAEAARAAAKLMYYGGDAAELLLALAMFAGWYRHSGRRLARQRRQPSTVEAQTGGGIRALSRGR